MSAATRRVERMNRHHRRHRTRPLWTVTTRGLVEGPPVPYHPGEVLVMPTPDASTFDDLIRRHGTIAPGPWS